MVIFLRDDGLGEEGHSSEEDIHLLDSSCLVEAWPGQDARCGRNMLVQAQVQVHGAEESWKRRDELAGAFD